MLPGGVILEGVMATAGIFIGWGDPKAGREGNALKSFEGAMTFFGQLLSQGEIESFEPVLLQPHGGDLNGFVRISDITRKMPSQRQFVESLASCWDRV